MAITSRAVVIGLLKSFGAKIMPNALGSKHGIIGFSFCPAGLWFDPSLIFSLSSLWDWNIYLAP
jgi:hypothetical protein